MSFVDDFFDWLVRWLGLVKTSTPAAEKPADKQPQPQPTPPGNNTTSEPIASITPNGPSTTPSRIPENMDLYKVVVEKNGINPATVVDLSLPGDGTLRVRLNDGTEKVLPYMDPAAIMATKIGIKVYHIKVDTKAFICTPGDPLHNPDVDDLDGFPNTGVGAGGLTITANSPFYGKKVTSLIDATKQTWGHEPDDPLGLKGYKAWGEAVSHNADPNASVTWDVVYERTSQGIDLNKPAGGGVAKVEVSRRKVCPAGTTLINGACWIVGTPSSPQTRQFPFDEEITWSDGSTTILKANPTGGSNTNAPSGGYADYNTPDNCYKQTFLGFDAGGNRLYKTEKVC